MKTIARGAEAVLRRDGDRLVKERVRKGYRVRELDDRIRLGRTRTEERMLSKARRAGVEAPMVIESSDSGIVMEYVGGRTVKEGLESLSAKDRSKACEQIGEAAARLHKAGIMHGDLTTSNMILPSMEMRKEWKGRAPGWDGRVVIIDFGLARSSRRVEDQAVDLFLLYEALKSAHYRFLDESWETIIKAYKYNYTIADSVLNRFSDIEKRRRYRGE